MNESAKDLALAPHIGNGLATSTRNRCAFPPTTHATPSRSRSSRMRVAPTLLRYRRERRCQAPRPRTLNAGTLLPQPLPPRSSAPTPAAHKWPSSRRDRRQELVQLNSSGPNHAAASVPLSCGIRVRVLGRKGDVRLRGGRRRARWRVAVRLFKVFSESDIDVRTV